MDAVISYAPALLWVALLSWMLYRHARLFLRYDRQLTAVALLEKHGKSEPGIRPVAENQRVRYMVRIGLAAFGLLIGLASIVNIAVTGGDENVALGLIVVAYLYASEALTGWLTVRDGRLLDQLEAYDRE